MEPTLDEAMTNLFATQHLIAVFGNGAPVKASAIQ